MVLLCNELYNCCDFCHGFAGAISSRNYIDVTELSVLFASFSQIHGFAICTNRFHHLQGVTLSVTSITPFRVKRGLYSLMWERSCSVGSHNLRLKSKE